MRILLLFTISALLLSCHTQDKTANKQIEDKIIRMHIDGVKFDSIDVILITTTQEKFFRQTLTSDDGYNWEFQIPDSTFSSYYISGYAGYNDGDSKRIIFVVNDSVRMNTIFFGNEKVSQLNLKLPSDSLKAYIKSEYDQTDIVKLLVEKGSDPEIARSIYFMTKYFEFGDGSYSYDEVRDKWLNLVSQHKDSYALTKYVKMLSDYFKVNDLKSIYNIFTEEIQCSDQGEWLRDFIDRKEKFTNFDNIKLRDWQTEKSESIIQNTTKYNLIIFSASWCGPCHKQIPLLKEIYNDLNSVVDIVYISIDDENGEKNWKELMIKEEIPWRSLFTGENKKEVLNKYFVTDIPASYLVYPDGTLEKIDVRKETDKDKLYLLIKEL